MMAGVGTLGPIGTGISATYFLSDVVIGHDNIERWHRRNTNPNHCKNPFLVGPK